MEYSDKDFTEINNTLQEVYGTCYIMNHSDAVFQWAAARCSNPKLAMWSLNCRRKERGLPWIYS